MKCYIDNRLVPEREFWLKVGALATREQKVRILDGLKVILAGSEYQVEVK